MYTAARVLYRRVCGIHYVRHLSYDRSIFLKQPLLVVALVLFTHAALASEATPATLERFLDAYQLEPVREIWAFRLEKEIKAELEKLRATPGLSSATRNAITKYESAAVAELQKRLTSENLRPRYAAIFGKVFTEEEMQEIARFYESPAGKASVKKRGQVAALIQEQFVGLAQEMSANLASVRREVLESVNKQQGK